MIGKVKRKIRVSMMFTTLFWCALITLLLWGILLKLNQTDRVLEVMLVCLCMTLIAELITFFASLSQCHQFTKHINKQNNIQLIDADTFQKINKKYTLGAAWLVYHTGIHYFVFSKENNTFQFDQKHLYVKDGQDQAYCFPIDQKTSQKIQQWIVA